MRYAYPCTLIPEREGGIRVSFPDVPEALTGGNDYQETLELAEDALTVALGSYVRELCDIPVPSPLAEGQELIAVSPGLAAKLALYATMRAQGMTECALAERLGISESAVRKLTDPRHRSYIDQVDEALKLLGRCLVIEDQVTRRTHLTELPGETSDLPTVK